MPTKKDTAVLDEIAALQANGPMIHKDKKRIIEEEVAYDQALQKARKELDNIAGNITKFPMHAFPERLRNVLSTFAKCSGFPVEFYAGGALAVASTLLGNKYLIKAKRGFTQSPMLYLGIVAKSGVGKTPPMQTCLSAIYRIEKEYRAEWSVDKDKWKQECYDIQNSTIKEDLPPKPPQKELLIDDATLEDLHDALEHNPTGVILFQDELTGWIGSFDRYRKGSDQSAWLQIWNNPELRKIGRKGEERKYIQRPFVTVFGGLQPGVLGSMADGDKIVNGFLARFLFIFPDKIEPRVWNEVEPDQSVYDAYHSIMKWMHKSPSLIQKDPDGRVWDVNSIEIPLSREAKDLYVAYYNPIGADVVIEEDEKLSSQLSKFQAYCLRFALIFQFLELADKFDEYKGFSIEDAGKMEISHSAMSSAITLAKYFQETAVKVLKRFDSPVNTLPVKVQVWYRQLPITEFKTEMAITLAKDLDVMGRSRVFSYLNNSDLFKQAGRGLYQKKFL